MGIDYAMYQPISMSQNTGTEKYRAICRRHEDWIYLFCIGLPVSNALEKGMIEEFSTFQRAGKGQSLRILLNHANRIRLLGKVTGFPTHWMRVSFADPPRPMLWKWVKPSVNGSSNAPDEGCSLVQRHTTGQSQH